MRPALTGGSTGEPFRAYHDTRVPTLPLRAHVPVVGSPAVDDLARVGRWGFGARASAANAIQWWPTRQVYTDASLIDHSSLGAFVGRIERVRPALIEGYVGAMLELARYVEEEGVQPGAACGGDDGRADDRGRPPRLQTVLGAPVYDETARQTGWMAASAGSRTVCTASPTCAASRSSTRRTGPWRRASSVTWWSRISPTGSFAGPLPPRRQRFARRAAVRVRRHPAPDGQARRTDDRPAPAAERSGHGHGPRHVRRLSGRRASSRSIRRPTTRSRSAWCADRSRTPTRRSSPRWASARARPRRGPGARRVLDELQYYKGKVKYVICEVPDPAT